MQINARWLGNAGFEFILGKITLMVDPFLTRPKPSKIYFGSISPDNQAVQKIIQICSHILVSHTHFDHFMDVPEIALRTGASIYGSANTCNLAMKFGIPENHIHRISAGDEFRIGEIMIKVIPAAHPWIPGYTRGTLKKSLHWPLRLRDYRMDSCLSFLLHFRIRAF